MVPLNKAALAALEDLKTAPGYKPDGFIIHNKDGGAVLPRTLEETLENMCAAVGIPENRRPFLAAHVCNTAFRERL